MSRLLTRAKPHGSLRVRAMTFAGTAALMVIALWAADFRIGSVDLAQWSQSLRDWWEHDSTPERDERFAVAPQLPTPTTSAKPVGELPETLPGTDASVSSVPLALTLVATTPGRNAREGTARLGTHRENPQTYSAGALLSNGARLVEIYERYVVLERGGKQVQLHIGKPMKGDDLLAQVGGEPAATRPAATTYSESLTDYIRPTPSYDGLTLRGFQVYAGQRSGVFSQLGLLNGDIVLALNDQPLADAQQAMDLFKQLTTGTAMTATIDRNGSRQRLSLDGALIAQDQEMLKQPPPASESPMMVPQT